MFKADNRDTRQGGWPSWHPLPGFTPSLTEPTGLGYLAAAAILFALRIAFQVDQLRVLAAGSTSRLVALVAVQAAQWALIGISAAWVAKDAWRHKLHQGWAAAVLLVLPIALPIYVGRRFGFIKGVLVALVVVALLVASVLAVVAIARPPSPAGARRTPRVAPWPMFMQNPRHNGQTPFAIGHPQAGGGLEIVLTDATGAGSPAVGKDGTLYFGNSEGDLYALAPNGAGDERWVFHTSQEITSSPAIGPDGTVYFAGDKFYAVRPDGKLKWAFDVRVGGQAPAVGLDGMVYLGSSNGLHALTPDGKQRWFFKAKRRAQPEIVSYAAIGDDGTIYYGAGQVMNALRPEGAVKWRRGYHSPITSYPLVGRDGSVYFSTRDGVLHAVTAQGSTKWSRPVGGQGILAAMDDQGVLHFGDARGFLIAMDSTGREKWRTQVGEAAWLPPIIDAAGTFYYPGPHGQLLAITSEGNVAWSSSFFNALPSPMPPSSHLSPPAVGNQGQIYFNAGNEVDFLSEIPPVK